MTIRMRGLVVSAAVLCAACLVFADDDDLFRGPDGFKGIKYRWVGPAVGGRATRVQGVPGSPGVYWLGTAAGGIFKSTDGGVRFKPVFDDQPVASVGSLAVAPSNPSVVYVGTGEANIRGNVKPGVGIFKTTDGGSTWTHVFKQEGQIGTMAVDPRNPDIAFAAILGKAFGPNRERGVYRTKDGGKTWVQVVAVDENTGASDVAIDPSNPNVVFAGFWQTRRTPWSMTTGGPGSSLRVSRDGGDTWKKLTEGLPGGSWGKVGVAVAPSNPDRVYALIEAEKGGLFRSNDGGKSFTLVNEQRGIRQRAWYYSTMTVDPWNPDVVWFPQVPLLKTVDGGKTITKVTGLSHGDNHDAWIDPKDPRRIAIASDGGVDLSINGGASWFAPDLPIGQCYRLDVDAAVPYRVSCAQQDLGTASGPSDSLSSAGITLGDWESVGGGEAGHTASDPSDPDIVWAGEYMGIITRWNRRTGLSRNVSIAPDDFSGHGPIDARYRFQWTAPILVSAHDSKTVYHAANVVFRTTDDGQTWTAISQDLTRNDKSKQSWSGGPITGDNTGVEWYGTVFALAESPKLKGLLWAGTDDGRVHVTRDGGEHWTDVTGNLPGLPKWATVQTIEPSSWDEGTAYLVAHAYRLDDPKPYLYKTADHGKTWKSLAKGLDPGVFLHCVREDPVKKGMLYVGTDRGVAFSRDDGATWQSLMLNLPTVPVEDLRVKNGDLVVATHGRSIFILDDLTAVREMTPAIAGQALYAFTPRPAVRWQYREEFHDEGPGKNPIHGASVDFWVKNKPKKEVTLEIRDASGVKVRTLSSKKREPDYAEDDPDAPDEEPKAELTAEAGMLRAAWDLTAERPARVKGTKAEYSSDTGARVPPGTYTLELHVDGAKVKTTVEVKPDPRISIPTSVLESQYAFAKRVSETIGRLVGTVNAMRSVREQLATRVKALASDPKSASWIADANKVQEKTLSLERELHNPDAQVEYDILAKGTKLLSRLNMVFASAGYGDGEPTQGMREVFDLLSQAFNDVDARWQAFVSTDLAKLDAKAAAAGQGAVIVPANP
jgi:photosystem II stability/assembly factor-like uncharacterized protein